MNKRRFIEKQNEIIRKSNKQKVLENRLARLERTVNESISYDPAQVLLDAADEGVLSWEELARELIAEASADDLQRTCELLDLCDIDDTFEDDDDDLWNESIRRRRRR